MESNADDRKDAFSAVLTAGLAVGHYKIIAPLGSGGMGEVYLAEDTELNRKVALKFLPPHLCQDPDCRARFKREAQAAAKLNHPNIVTVHEVSEFQGRPLFAMEYVDGLPLDIYVKDKNLSLGGIVELAVQICEGLKDAHANGIIHRDIKPGNILVDKNGRAKLLDFGLAAIKGDKKLTKTGSTLGTISYMSPEQTRGEAVDNRSDLFSFGVVLYEMITGQLPFKGDHEPAIIYSIGHESPEPLARYRNGVPDELQRIISKALTKDGNLRYQHADDLATDLKRVTNRADTRAGLKRSKHRIVWASLVIVCVIAIALVLKPWELVNKSTDKATAKGQRIVIVPFRNQTNEPSLDPLGKMVADWTTQSLLQTGLAPVVPPQALLELDASKNIRALASATGAGIIVTGSYYKVGDSLQFQAQVSTANEKLLTAIEPAYSSTAKVMDAVELVRQRILGALAVLLDERLLGIVQQGATPPKYEAYQEYMQGFDDFIRRNDYVGALGHSKRAYAIDTSYLDPLIQAAGAYINLGRYAELDSILEFLSLRRARLTIFQQLALEQVDGLLSGDRLKALEATRKGAKLAPGSGFEYEVGWQAAFLNRPNEAIEALKAVDPKVGWARDWRWYWRIYAQAYHLLGDHEKELEIVKQGRALYPSDLPLLNAEIGALAALGKIEELMKLIEASFTWTPSTAASRNSVMRLSAEELRAHGYETEAMAQLEQAIRWYQSQPADELKNLQYEYALTLYDARRWEEAKSIIAELAREYPEGWTQWLGIVAARQGDRKMALSISDWLRDLKKPYLFGENTYNRACIAAVLGDKDQAIALLKESFRQGRAFTVDLHRDFDFEALWSYPPFRELMRPKD